VLEEAVRVLAQVHPVCEEVPKFISLFNRRRIPPIFLWFQLHGEQKIQILSEHVFLITTSIFL